MRILFVTSNRIGDAVLSTGLLGHLIDTWPQARITLACGPAAAPLFADTPNIEKLIAMVKQRRAGHWLALWRQCAGQVWDLVVDLRASALAWMLWARRRAVLRKGDAPIHRVKLIASVLGLDPPPAPRLYIGADRHRRAAELLPDGAPVLALGPTANWGGKQWPADRFAAVAHDLLAPGGLLAGGRVALFAGPNERGPVDALKAGLPGEDVIDLAGSIDLLTAAACLQRCVLYVGNDSGLMHLAAAAGVPTLGLFGPSPDVHYAPWGEHAAFVRTPESFEQIVRAPGYDWRKQNSLMTTLSVDSVVQAASRLLARP